MIRMFTLGDEIELEIRDLSSQGEGVGSFQGMTLFIEGALIGEKVKAKVTLVKKQYAKGDLVKVIQSSSHRVKPICPIFDECGGCQIMHLSYDEQLKVKKGRVLSAFERIGGFENVPLEDVRPSVKPLHYRNKITLPISLQGGEKVIGLYAKRSHDIVPVSHCYIHLEEGEKIFASLKKDLPPVKHVVIRTAEHSKESLLLFLTSQKSDLIPYAKALIKEHPSIVGVVQGSVDEERNSLFASAYQTLQGKDYLKESFAGYQVKISAPSFFQVNTLQAEALYREAIKAAELSSDEVVLDAYSGIGLLTMMIARGVKKVMGIEIAPTSIADAKENVKMNQIKNIEWFKGTTEEWIEKVPSYDKVFLNPPRGGCEPSVLEALTKGDATKIVYISCDPATLARDGSILKAKGWQLDRVTPFDMFPQTMHVESVATFSRASFHPL